MNTLLALISALIIFAATGNDLDTNRSLRGAMMDTKENPKCGLKLTGRGLIALPRDNHAVYLTWRCLEQDGIDSSYEIFRSTKATDGFEKIGIASDSTTYRDSSGHGIFYYRVKPLDGAFSNTAKVETSKQGRDWVEIIPAARGKKLQFSDRHFADTDGDGELEFVAYYPQVPSYRGGAVSETFKIQVYKLFENEEPKWTFDTGMGMQTEPFSEGDKRMDWDYEWTFKPVAWDIDGDSKAEIITLAKMDGKYKYVVLKDMGDHYDMLYAMDSPIPVGVEDNNARHFPFFAYLGGENYSFVLQGGTYGHWQMWAYDWNGSGLELRWHIDSNAEGFKGNRSSSHSILIMDMDGDGFDEICNGVTIIDQDGSVKWAANDFFGNNAHVDGQVIDDIDPTNPGLEIMLFEERARGFPKDDPNNRYALYDLATGKSLWEKRAPGTHLQLNVAGNITGSGGLDIIGTYGGHRPKGGFACKYDGTDMEYPFPEYPINGDRMWAMDWDGDKGHQICLNFTRIYGEGGKLLYEIDFSDAPDGDVIPWNEHYLYQFWANVDIVGDHREDIIVQMKDGSIRAYVNTETLTTKRPCKWQNRAYQMLQAPGDYRYFIAVIQQEEN